MLQLSSLIISVFIFDLNLIFLYDSAYASFKVGLNLKLIKFTKALLKHHKRTHVFASPKRYVTFIEKKKAAKWSASI